jgi:hypothetical protein
MRRQLCWAKHGAGLLKEEATCWAWWCQRVWVAEYFRAETWSLVDWAMQATSDISMCNPTVGYVLAGLEAV